MKIISKIIYFFDQLEDIFRESLSRFPLLYAFLGGVGFVLFWRGVWMIADLFDFMTGPISMIIGLVILMVLGLLISTFVGNSIIIAGLKKEETEIGKMIKKIYKKERTTKKKKKK